MTIAFDTFLNQRSLIIFPVIFNAALFFLIYSLAAPDAIARLLDTLGIELVIVGPIALVLFAQYSGRGKSKYFRFGSLAIFLYMIHFHLGVLESVPGYSFIYEEGHSRPYVINGKTAHLLRAGSNGVFYSIRAPGEATLGAIFFEPWSQVKELRYQLRAPAGGS